MEHTNRQAVGFNVLYINNYPQDRMQTNDAFLPSSFAMQWCMHATFMNRLFTKEDVQEFLFRLAITLDTLGVVENWFAYDKLLNFQFRDTFEVLSADDILFHYGFEVTDSVKNKAEREFYLDNIKKGIKNAMFVGALEGCQVISPKKIGEDKLEISGMEYAPKVNKKLIQKAEFFANDILKMAPDGLFDYVSEEKKRKLKEIELRKDKITRLPQFDISKIPTDIIKKCMYIMYEAESAKEILDIPEDFETFGKPLIKLGWLWANDMMVSDDESASEIEGVDLNWDDYELQEDDAGINLLQTFDDYNLEECIPLLKGVGLK